jgi:uncharacterized membrane protein YidH (DUF202 family)
MDKDNQVEPDSRFVQANERTLLAWIRTGLALVTFGFVIARLGAWLNAVQAAPQPPSLVLVGCRPGRLFRGSRARGERAGARSLSTGA